MEPYAVYGHFYDVTQGTPDGAHYLHLLRRYHPMARSLLEIGCGTGAHLAPLVEHYAVTGLDLSRTMLRYARRRLPGVKFHRQNMAGFKLDASFDAVICPFDSINHLLKFADWVRTFKAAKRHLNAKGVFIFDINTEYRLRELANAPPWTHRFEDNYLIMEVALSANGVTDWDIRVFERVKKATYRLHQEVIKERSFGHEKVKGALQGCFDDVRAYDLAGWSRPKVSSKRLFYVCRLAADEALERTRYG